MSSTATRQAFLDSPADWKRWNRNIIIQAAAAGLRGVLEGTEPFPTDGPKDLTPEEMWAFSRTKQGNVRLGLTATGSVQPVEEGEPPRPLGVVTINDLDEQGFSRYQFQYWKLQTSNKLVKKKLEEVNKLVDHIHTTVATVYQYAHCHEDDNIAIWYANLKESLSLSPVRVGESQNRKGL